MCVTSLSGWNGPIMQLLVLSERFLTPLRRVLCVASTTMGQARSEWTACSNLSLLTLGSTILSSVRLNLRLKTVPVVLVLSQVIRMLKFLPARQTLIKLVTVPLLLIIKTCLPTCVFSVSYHV